jgi:hypothetical protein
MKRSLDLKGYDVPSPRVSLSLSSYPQPGSSDVPITFPGTNFPLPGHNTGANTARQTAVTTRLQHDSQNSPIAQRQCIFSLPSKADAECETLFNARAFNAEFAARQLEAKDLKIVVDELLFQGVAIGNTLSVDMSMSKSATRLPWNTGSPMIDIFVSGRVQMMDSWPDAKASERLYWILKPEWLNPREGNARNHRYKLQLEPVSRVLNDPSIADLVAVKQQPWIRGKFFCVGTAGDVLNVPVPDVSENIYNPLKTMQQEMMVRDRIVNISRPMFFR